MLLFGQFGVRSTQPIASLDEKGLFREDSGLM